MSSQQLRTRFRVAGWYEYASAVTRVIALHYEIELQLQRERDSSNHFISYEAGSRFRCIIRDIMVGLVRYLLRLTTHSGDYSCNLKCNFVIMQKEPELSHYVYMYKNNCAKRNFERLCLFGQERKGWPANCNGGREHHYSTIALLGFWDYKQGGCRGTEMKAGMGDGMQGRGG